MSTQHIDIELPDDIYRRLEDAATLTQRPLEDVISQTIRGNLPPVLGDVAPDHRDLVADLQRLGDESLWAIGKEPLPSTEWRRHQRLLHKSERGILTLAEQTALDQLREASDRFVTRRSYALALLRWRGYTIPSIP